MHPTSAPALPPDSGITGVPGSEQAESGLAAELRDSLLLLAFAVLVTVGLTALAQAALTSFA